MANANGVDLVLGPGWICIEHAARNLFGFVPWVFQSDGLGCFDRKKLWSSTRFGSRGDRVGSDLAVQRTNGKVGVESSVLCELVDFISCELGRRHLVRRCTGAFENGPQDCEVGIGLSDDADLVTCQIGDLSD